MRKRLFVGCGLGFVIMCLVVLMGARSLFAPRPKPQTTETADRGDVQIAVVETGVIDSLSKVEVKSKVSGRVLRLYADEGVFVRKGQVLATIDPRDVNNQVAALRAQLAAAQARMEEARSNTRYQQAQTGAGIRQFQQNLSAAEARLREAQTDAKAQPDLTRESVDMARANLAAAEAALKAQQASLDLMVRSTNPQALVSAQSTYDEAAAQLTNSRRNLARQKELLTRGYVAQEVVDSADTDTAVAAAQVADAKEKLDRIKQSNALQEANARSQVANAQATVSEMAAALAQAKSSVLPVTKQQELDNARAAYRQAAAQLAAAQSGKTQDVMRQDEAQAAAADVDQIRNQLNEQLVQLHDTTLDASMNGVVTKKYVEPGELIESGIASFSSGSPVFEIADLSTMLVNIDINEVDIAKVRLGLPVEVSIDAAPGVIFHGVVRKVAPAALTAGGTASTSSTTSTSNSQGVIRFAVQVRIEHADARLRLGMSAKCTIVVARRRNVIRVPGSCVQGGGTHATVQVVQTITKNGEKTETTTPRPVTVGLRGDAFDEIRSGLRVGERVKPSPYAGPARKGFDMSTRMGG